VSRNVLRLLGRYVLLTAGLVLLNFWIPRALPGDPLAFVSGTGTDPAVPLSAEAVTQLREYYHLDEPLHRQLRSYLADLASGDLGWSIARPTPVSTLIADRLPWTLGLLLTALALSTLLGTACGILAGWRPGRRRDHVLVSVAGMVAALPEFLIAIGTLIIFAAGLGWFPLYGGKTPFASYGGIAGTIRHFGDIAWHLTLPAVTLVIAGTPAFVLLARDLTAGMQRQEWLVAARAKGLSEPRIAMRHLLPNIIPPLLTLFGVRLGAIAGGAIVVERVFGIPGLGMLGFEALRARDYPVLQALFLVSGLSVLAANFALEILYLRLRGRGTLDHA
jgi:peptide/nickel transport system permease protein